jgi:transposase
MTFVREMPVKAIAEMVNEHDTMLWRIVHHYVNEARKEEDFSEVTAVAVDETSRCKGHNYVTIFAEANSGKVLFVTEGKDKSTISKFAEDLENHRGASDNVKEFSSDMSSAFIAGIKQEFPNAGITFDKFHLIKMLNDAVDEVRRQEQKEHPEIRNSRYVWLKNEANLTANQRHIE